jgi:polyisoprenoid-binding protein YceI
MKNIIVLFLLFAIQQQVYGQRIANANISFTFVAKDVDGTIDGFSSTSTIDWDTPENSVIEGTVLSETIKTGNFLRDWSLRGSKYFNADEHPKISFKSTTVKRENDALLVNGNLTIKGITKPITIRFTKNGKKLLGTTTLFSSDFDITILKKGRESNKVRVQFNLELE